MIKGSKIRRQPVPARPSRIRRDPLRVQAVQERKVAPPSREREILLGIAGVALFAIAIAVATTGVSVVTASNTSAAPVAAPSQQFGRCGIGDSPNCVVDGDTIHIADESLQIAGIEAPRLMGAACDKEAQRGSDAVEQLMEILNGGKVTTAGEVREPDGSVRTKVLVDGRDAGAAMMSAGMAKDYGSEVGSWCD